MRNVWYLFVICVYGSCNFNQSVKEHSSDSKLFFDSIPFYWNNSLNKQDMKSYAFLIADTVSHYGKKASAAEVIASKKKFFELNKDFSQSISHVKKTILTDDMIEFSFIKNTKINGKDKKFISYIRLKKIKDNWKIVTESDETTDKNLKNLLALNSAPKNSIIGDFDGDGLKERAWVRSPIVITEMMDCKGDCISWIKFTNEKLDSISIPSSIGGDLYNLGDLNYDGTDEIGILPAWFTSCWHSFYSFTYKNGKFIEFVAPINTHCMQWEDGKMPVEKSTKRGFVKINFSLFTDDGIIIKTQELKLNN